MPRHESIEELEIVNAPWGKELTLSEATYEGGFKMFHTRIKEGKRITDLELDVETATYLGKMLSDWALKTKNAA